MSQIQHSHKRRMSQSNTLESNKWAQCHYLSDLRPTVHQPEETNSRGSGLVATNSAICVPGTDHTPTTPTQSRRTLHSGKTPRMSAKSPAKSQTRKGKWLGCEDIHEFYSILDDKRKDCKLCRYVHLSVQPYVFVCS